MRDYQDWHQRYDDPRSGLSWRLERVRHHINEVLDGRPGPLRVLSVCSGDGRDLLGVLAKRPDADRVSAVLIELHPVLAQQARDAAIDAGLSQIEVRTADASNPDAYDGAAPADLVLLVGILGNIADIDVWRLIDFAPRLCTPGATLIWSRGRHFTRELPGVTLGDLNDEVRARFAEACFTEIAYQTHDTSGLPALGVVLYEGSGTNEPLESGRLFTFLR